MGKPLRFCLHPTLPPCCLQFSHFFPLLPLVFHSLHCLSATEGQRQVSGFEDTAIATSIPLDEGPVWQDNHLGGILMKLCQELGDNLKKEGDGEYTNFQITKNAFWQMRQPVHSCCKEATHNSHKGVRQSKGLGNPRTLDPRRGMDLPPWIVENENHHHHHHHCRHHPDRQTRACSSSTTSPGLIVLLAKTTRPTPSILNSMKI